MKSKGGQDGTEHSHQQGDLSANGAGLRRAWTYTTGDAIQSSPVVVGRVVYIGSRDHNLYALEARIGKKLWSYTTGGGIISSPAVADGVVYAGSNDHSLYAFRQIYPSSEEKRE